MNESESDKYSKTRGTDIISGKFFEISNIDLVKTILTDNSCSGRNCNNSAITDFNATGLVFEIFEIK